MMNKNTAIVIIGGGLTKDPSGKWRTNTFDDSGDHAGITGDRLRVEAGATLYHQRPSLVITTGYKGYLKKIPVSPVIARVMKQELVDLSVPAEKIIAEDKSDSTYQDLQALIAMVKKYDIKNIIIVSNRWHLPRIKAMVTHHPKLKKAYQNFNVKCVAAEDVLINNNPKKWQSAIEKAYATKEMKKRIQSERQGIRQIKQGTYRF